MYKLYIIFFYLDYSIYVAYLGIKIWLIYKLYFEQTNNIGNLFVFNRQTLNTCIKNIDNSYMQNNGNMVNDF
jgi:hypothetical protein